MSETATCRERLMPYCQGCGLDIGFGGDPIVPWAITIDYNPETKPQIVCDASNLPFKDAVLDFVYSSHALEDFQRTGDALMEWLRVIKPGGYLVLFLPDQATYAARCLVDGILPNQAHKHAEFSLEFVKAALNAACSPPTWKIVHELFPVPGNPYSFDLVIQKL